MKTKYTGMRKFDIQHFASDDGNDGGSTEKQFTQEDMNDLAKKVRGEEKRKYAAAEKALKDSYEEDISNLNESLKAEKTKVADYDNVKQQLEEANGKITEFNSEKESAELADKLKELGVKSDRVEAFSKLIGEDKTEEALKKTLEDFPEFKASATTPKWSTEGNPNGAGAAKDKPMTMREALEQKMNNNNE
ncbi:hypothetical protein HCA78_12750 [Listeria booriae]|uniref:Scaffolding protein n=1 Tax=Listeria booriae TaxID=1552123 RepID=A0A842CU97_9LIST|nr:hypothetical protein [Listeria booriae]MBC2004646.1 hypothetical protein [Listeria booriae]